MSHVDATAGLTASSRRVSLLFIFALLLAGTACGSDDTTETVDCPTLCARYADCVEAIDVPECTATCQHHVGISRVYALSAITCQQCIEGRSCDAAATCWDTCPVRPAD